MQKATLLLSLLVSLAPVLGTSPAPAAEPQGSAHVERFFEFSGHTRSYYLHLPENLPEGAPMVFVIHGYGGSGKTMIPFSGMNPVADANSFAAVYPQGMPFEEGKYFWNVGYTDHKDLEYDDVEFLAALAGHLQKEFSLSNSSTFCTGMSNGGDMCYLLACRRPDVFSAAAPVAGCLMKWIHDTCQTTAPVPVLEIHGTQDLITLWDGDMADTQEYGGYLSVRDTFEFWIEKNRCSRAVTETLPDTNTEDGSRVLIEKHTGCVDGHEVWLYSLVGGEHDWPGSWGNRDVNAAEEVWKFLERFVDSGVAN